jgi:hypothetical protein
MFTRHLGIRQYGLKEGELGPARRAKLLCHVVHSAIVLAEPERIRVELLPLCQVSLFVQDIGKTRHAVSQPLP